MYKKFSLLLFGFLFGYTKCKECDRLGILLYEDLRCKPRAKNPCPSYYECQEFKKSEKYCLFQNEEIPVDQNVNDTFIYSTCRISCRCIKSEENDMANFICAVLDCPEALGSELKAPDCYWTYNLNECCSIGQNCPPFENSIKCKVEGKEYREGELFYPSNTCLNCVCLKGFEGKFVEPFCKRRACAEQIDNLEKLINNCAPVYFDDILCCPSEWVCSTKFDRIKRISSSRSDSNLTCRWGKELLKLGEGLETQVEHFGKMEEITCECILPPFLTCKRSKK